MNQLDSIMIPKAKVKLIPRIIYLVVFMLTFSLESVYSNNVQIDINPKVVNQNKTTDVATIQFDISWENSWRNATNWDAVWVFAKYRVGATGTWEHAYLSTTASDHSIATINGVPGTIKIATSDVLGTPRGMGAFLYRSANGTGNINWDAVKLRWNYGENGVGDDDAITLKVFAIEMVNVPQGSFYVGDGASNAFLQDGATTLPYQITSQSSLTLGAAAGQINWNPQGATTTGIASGSTNALFPTGFNSFYCMKYYITQEQYVSFLNCLSYTQQAAHTNSAPNSIAGTRVMYANGGTNPTNQITRNNIEIKTPGINPGTPAVYANDLTGFTPTVDPPAPAPTGDNNLDQADDGQNLPCNFLLWNDMIAYADWSGLRPMTELEFEKAARGTATPVANEFAWGTTNIFQSTGMLNSGQVNETSKLATENCVYGYSAILNPTLAPPGPLRVGAFASTTSTRESSGASFYGIMEMSGSLYERVITIGIAEGQAFTGLHGNGSITAAGLADVSNWPATVGTEARGTGYKGGSFTASSNASRVSDRSFVSLYTGATNRPKAYGFRLVRTAP